MGIKHVFVRKVYSFPKCPICGKKMELDDIEVQFQGCQNEWHLCNDCLTTAYTRVRYDNVVDIVYTDTDAEVIKTERPCNEFR